MWGKDAVVSYNVNIYPFVHKVVEWCYPFPHIAGILHKEREVPQSMVFAAACIPQNMDICAAPFGDKAKGKAESLGLVISFLTAALPYYIFIEILKLCSGIQLMHL